MNIKHIIIGALTLFINQIQCARTPIGQAIHEHDLAKVKDLILNKKASITDSCSTEYNLPLINRAVHHYEDAKKTSDIITIKNAFDIIKFLVDNEASVNKPDHMGNLPLLIAIIQDVPEVVDLLLDNGADIKVAYYDDDPQNTVIATETPLFYATKSNKPEIVKILLDHGAPTKIPEEGLTPYALTISHTDPNDDYKAPKWISQATPKDRAEIRKMFDMHSTNLEKAVNKKQTPFSDLDICFTPH